MNRPPALDLRGISKRFGAIPAVSHVDFRVNAGEIHALLGENGAGKSTLMAIAAGLVKPDAGEIRINGVIQDLHSARQARLLGIGMIHQHFTSIPSFTVAENVAIAAGWKLGRRARRDRVREIAESAGWQLDADAMVSSLSVAQKQRLEIVKALAGNPRVLLLDEPTAVLGPAEATQLFDVILAYVERGNAAVLITHKLEEALSAASRVTVLRRGVVVRTGAISDESTSSLASAMIGEAPQAIERPDPTVMGETRIDVGGLTIPREDGRGIAVRDVSLTVRSGEIVGIAGMEGSGQRELLRSLAGLIKPIAGRMTVSEPTSFVPEDRTTEGIIPTLSLTENLVLGGRADAPWLRGSRIVWPAARVEMGNAIRRFAIQAASPEVRAGTLSGGNQQKIVMARALGRGPRVIIAENPTRGLDVRAASDVHEQLRAAAAAGAAVIFSSADLDEVILLAQRILIASAGRIRTAPHGVSRDHVGSLMLQEVD